jgi:hypothetical protein
MTGYVRMSVPPAEYLDGSGEVIPYGSRWPATGPPDDSYSRVSTPQRFLPLQAVARQLIAHLAREYGVEVATDPSFVSDFSNPEGVGEVVRLIPASPLAARLTFGFTSLPGVFLAAGAFHQFAFPSCGCDACDEDTDAQLDQLEETVFAVVDGDYREWATGPEVGFTLRSRSGSRSGRGAARDIDPGRLAAGLSALPQAGVDWIPWPKER